MDDNKELLVIYRKKSYLTYSISRIFETGTMRSGLINRFFMVNTIGDYNMIYSRDTDIETIIKELKIECMGEEIEDDGGKDEQVKDDLQSSMDVI